MMKTLVIGLNWVGDIIMSFPMLTELYRQSGEKIDILTRPNLKVLYEFHPGVGKCHKVNTRAPFWRFLSVIKTIRRENYQKIFILPQSFRSAWIGFLCGGLERIGFATQWRSLLLHRSVQLPQNFETIHESDLYQMLCGNGRTDDLPLYTCSDNLLQHLRHKFALKKHYAVIAPGAAFGAAKRWLPERFREVGKELVQKRKLQIVITGTASEYEIADSVATGNPQALNLAGKTTLPELLTLLSGASLLIANDSGTMHLGALARTPLVVPVGPTDMTRTGPLSHKIRLVSADNCVPCRKSVCPLMHNKCMTAIETSHIMAAIDSLLDQSQA